MGVGMKKTWMVSIVSTVTLLSFTGNAGAEGQAWFYLGRSYTDQFLLEDMTTFGGSIGAFGRIVGVEFALEYSPVKDFQVGALDFGASLTNVMGNLVVQIPIGDFYPYGTIGYGVLIGRANLDELPEEFLGNFGTLNFGFGGKIFFSDHVGVRLDYRRFAVQTGDEAPDLTLPFTDIQIEASPDLNRLAGGVTFRF